MKNKNAFTLIELLAIIVILAIIAVITVPIITKTLANSRKGAVIDSAYGYTGALHRYYLTKMVDDHNEDLPTGTYNITSLPSDFKVSGEAPSEGWVRLEDGEVIAYSLKFNSYVVTKTIDSEPAAEKDGEIASSSQPINGINTTGMTQGIKVGNVQYYTGGSTETPDNVVYFDPINGTYNCTTYHVDNSIVGFNGVITGTGSTKTTDNQTTCLKWFIYSIDDKGNIDESDDVVNLILDHNTTASIAWNNTDGNNSTNYTGPNSAFLTQLTNDTSAWTSNKIITPSAYTATWDYDKNNNNTIDADEHNTYTITYTTKAKILDADEVAKIKGENSFSYLTMAAPINNNKYNFLKKNLSSSGNTNEGFWTVTPNVYSNRYIWFVRYDAILDNYHIAYDTVDGIRPVISIYK